MKKRSMSILLAFCLLAALLPTGARAEAGWGGSGTERDPYLITDAGDLLALAEAVNAGMSYKNIFFLLTTDIDLSGLCHVVDGTPARDVSWTPIGSDIGRAFNGVFDGGGHTVSGLYIDLPLPTGADGELVTEGALFGCLGSAAVVRSLTVAGSVTAGIAGGVAALNAEGTVEDCVSACRVTGGDFSGGGIVGENRGAIINCSNSGDVTAGGWAGGIAGISYGVIKGCANGGGVACSSDWSGEAGGIAGHNDNDGTIEDCRNTAPVTGGGEYARVGGVVGSSDGAVKNCSNAGSVTAGDGGFANAGGIAGVAGRPVENCRNSGGVTAGGGEYGSAGGVAGWCLSTMTGCRNTGDVSGNCAGGVAGLNYGAMTRCSNAGGVTGGSAAGGVAGENNIAAMEDCYNTGSVAGTGGDTCAGGVVGRNYETALARCYSAGSVTGSGDKTGGVAGLVEFASLESCCYLQSGAVNAGLDAIGAAGAAIGIIKDTRALAAAEFAVPDSFADWDPAVWEIWSGLDPALSPVTIRPVLSGVGEDMGAADDTDYSDLLPSPPAFSDVDPGDYYYDAVLWAVDHEPKITVGMGDGTFGSGSTVTRAQAMTFLWRAMGEPETDSDDDPFEDVHETDYYYKAVLWAIEQGITAGTDETHFSPAQTCSTAHIVTFIYRTLGAGSNGWYEEAAAWAGSAGMLSGMDTVVSPYVDCPRADVVTFLYRALA